MALTGSPSETAPPLGTCTNWNLYTIIVVVYIDFLSFLLFGFSAYYFQKERQSDSSFSSFIFSAAWIHKVDIYLFLLSFIIFLFLFLLLPSFELLGKKSLIIQRDWPSLSSSCPNSPYYTTHSPFKWRLRKP